VDVRPLLSAISVSLCSDGDSSQTLSHQRRQAKIELRRGEKPAADPAASICVRYGDCGRVGGDTVPYRAPSEGNTPRDG
jgi:hypothetical protein